MSPYSSYSTVHTQPSMSIRRRLRHRSHSGSGRFSITQGKPLLSPVIPYLGSFVKTLDHWISGDDVPGILIPVAFLSTLGANLQMSSVSEDSIFTPLAPPPLKYGIDSSRLVPPSLCPSSSSIKHRKCDSRVNSISHDYASPIVSDKASNDTSPSISVSPCQTENELSSALQLIEDTVDEQRQLAVKAILFHPLVFAVIIISLLSTVKLLYTGSLQDILLLLSILAAIIGSAFFVTQFTICGYQPRTVRAGGYSWLSETSCHTPLQPREVFVARARSSNSKPGDGRNCNGSIVGVVIMRICRTPTGTPAQGLKPRSSRRRSSTRWTGIIQAWAVKRSARSNGVGTKLLEEVVANCRLRSLDGPIFADDHAHSGKFLSSFFDTGFDKREKLARSTLDNAIMAHRNR